jgi:hypothetical protein
MKYITYLDCGILGDDFRAECEMSYEPDTTDSDFDRVVCESVVLEVTVGTITIKQDIYNDIDPLEIMSIEDEALEDDAFMSSLRYEYDDGTKPCDFTVRKNAVEEGRL